MEGKNKKENGITLIALVITIIVLLILAGVTIATLTGENGILTMVNKAKEQTEIAKEKEQLRLAVTEAIGFNEKGLNQTNLQNILNKNLGEGKAVVTYDEEEGILYVKFIESERIYKINKNGKVTYIGKESELILEATIEAIPESNTTPELYQLVDVKAEIPMKVEDTEYSLVYAWSTNKDKMPEDKEFIDSTATGTGRIKEATITSSDTIEGNYYLWARIVVGNRSKTECFGPYVIKDHTTLINTPLEAGKESGFLGNEEIQRRKIKSVNIVKSLEGHTKNDSKTWDVSQSKDGKYLAWYEEDDKGYYTVTIGGNGGVVANSNSQNLFKNIGSEVENEEVTIKGLENLDTGLVTNMGYMFSNSKVENLDLSSFNTSTVVSSMVSMFQNCSNLIQLDLSNFDTGNVTDMRYMFSGCTNLTQLDVSNFNTNQVSLMKNMFQNCSNLEKIDVSSFDTSNVIDMSLMFYGCTSLTYLDISSNFNTNNVIYLTRMFQSCSNLLKLDLNVFNTNNVTNMSEMFSRMF